MGARDERSFMKNAAQCSWLSVDSHDLVIYGQDVYQGSGSVRVLRSQIFAYLLCVYLCIKPGSRAGWRSVVCYLSFDDGLSHREDLMTLP